MRIAKSPMIEAPRTACETTVSEVKLTAIEANTTQARLAIDIRVIDSEVGGSLLNS